MATSDDQHVRVSTQDGAGNAQDQPQEPVARPQANEEGNDKSPGQLDQESQQNQDQSNADNDPSVNDGSPGREQPTQPNEGVGGDKLSND